MDKSALAQPMRPSRSRQDQNRAKDGIDAWVQHRNGA